MKSANKINPSILLNNRRKSFLGPTPRKAFKLSLKELKKLPVQDRHRGNLDQDKIYRKSSLRSAFQ